ncbi:hypothetical protein PGB90_006203 [Kerria lacca]
MLPGQGKVLQSKYFISHHHAVECFDECLTTNTGFLNKTQSIALFFILKESNCVHSGNDEGITCVWNGNLKARKKIMTINEWLSNFKNKNSEEYHTHLATVIRNNDVISALYSYLDDINKYQGIVSVVDVCDMLFKYYRSSELDLKQFTLQFLPQILYLYLNAIAQSDKKISNIIETLIIGIYNLEVVDENGHSKILSFRLPSLAESSIYHEPISLAPASLTESALKRLERRDTQLVRWGPFHPVEKLIAQNRLSIISELLFCYNRHISSLSQTSVKKLCEVTLKIMNQGFIDQRSEIETMRRPSRTLNDDNRPRRIAVSSSFLCRLLHNLFYAIYLDFKEKPGLVIDAIEAVAIRANYQGLNDVILLTNAIKNRYHCLNADQSETTTVGTNVSVTSTVPSTTTTTLSKSMITNASFRTKKLPEDIPIQDPQQDGLENLGAISEEKDENSSTPEIHPRRSLPKMAASFGKKTKEKIAIAVKSGSVTGMRGISKTNSIIINGGDASETDESGIDIGGSDISNLANMENDNSTTPFNNRKIPQVNNTLDIDIARSMQVSSV